MASTFTVLDSAAVDAVGVHDDEVHGTRVLRGIVAREVGVAEVDYVAKLTQVYALKVAAIPAIDPVVVEVLMVVQYTLEALGSLLSAFFAACFSRTTTAGAEFANVGIEFTCEYASDDGVLSTSPLAHLVRGRILRCVRTGIQHGGLLHVPCSPYHPSSYPSETLAAAVAQVAQPREWHPRFRRFGARLQSPSLHRGIPVYPPCVLVCAKAQGHYTPAASAVMFDGRSCPPPRTIPWLLGGGDRILAQCLAQVSCPWFVET